jgi:nucleotide-binding universal stress UspA family protein
MKTIIVPTDFSPASVNAMNFAANMALAIGADLRLLHVYGIPPAYTEPLLVVSPEDIKFSADLQLEALKQQVVSITNGKVTVICETIMGNIIDELGSYCKRVQPFAVVMGAKGKTGLEKVIFGSTALSAIRRLTWPVICVSPGKEYGKGIKKIGLACDFREVQDTVPVNYIRNIVAAFGAELHVLHVDYLERKFKADTPLESSHLHAMLEDIRPVYHFIDYPDVEEGIYGFAESHGLDLVIVIPKKHNLLEKLFKPSSARQLVFQSPVPIMCVHE